MKIKIELKRKRFPSVLEEGREIVTGVQTQSGTSSWQGLGAAKPLSNVLHDVCSSTV
jgi:hypothetical protein